MTIKKIAKCGIDGITYGVTIGMILSLIFSYLAGSSSYYPSTPAFVAGFNNNLTATLISVLLWMVIGLFSAYSSIIFELENISLWIKTVIHFCLVYAIVLAVGIYLKWFTTNGFILVTISFVVVYAAIWVITWLTIKNDIKRINQQITKLKEK